MHKSAKLVISSPAASISATAAGIRKQSWKQQKQTRWKSKKDGRKEQPYKDDNNQKPTLTLIIIYKTRHKNKK